MKDKKQKFDPKDYWEKRLSSDFSLASVGYIGMGEGFNRWIYRVRKNVFIREIKRLKLQVNDVEILDVGSGTGFYVELWKSCGAKKIVASDLTETAVRNLREKFSDVESVQFDITGEVPQELKGRQFDIITAMDVLFHIVDDRGYEQAFQNFKKLLKKEGLLIFTENLLPEKRISAKYMVSRTEEEVKAILKREGFDVVRIVPMFFLMNAPVSSSSPVLRKWWEILHRTVVRHQRAGGVIGMFLYLPELVFLRMIRSGPSTKLVVCRLKQGILEASKQ